MGMIKDQQKFILDNVIHRYLEIDPDEIALEKITSDYQYSSYQYSDRGNGVNIKISYNSKDRWWTITMVVKINGLAGENVNIIKFPEDEINKSVEIMLS